MSFLEKIKNFFNKQKIKALPEGNIENTQYSTRNNAWILPNNTYQKPTQLDMNIDRFLQTYFNMIEQVDTTQPIYQNQIPRAYSALVSMNGKQVMQDEYNNNYQNEQELFQQLEYQHRYGVENQINNGRTVFYHIKSKGYQMPEFKDMVRIYVNCSNANIAELSNAILDSNTNPNFYLKFAANDENVRHPRSEKIVIYCDKQETDYSINLLKYVKDIRPDLFIDSENTVPFLQNVDNIASVSMQPTTNQYTDLYGRTSTIPQSTNSYLATILQESYMETAKEIARTDQNLSFMLQDQYINDNFWYMKNYEYINANYHEYLLKSMEAKMEVLSQKNNIYIDGLHYQQYTRNDNIQQRDDSQR